MDSKDPIAIVIAKDGNAFAFPDTAEYTCRGFLHRRNRKRIQKIVPRWNLQEGVDVLYATLGKHFK
ncbi:MAG TPA: hypothetical protein VK578_05730 [Edaphobacter sp.]|nr:hypothetical protein [Edaphobacter sp.]